MDGHDHLDPAEIFRFTGAEEIPRGVRVAEIDASVEEIPERLFANCRLLEIVLLHEGLLRIGRAAFALCKSLRIFGCPKTVRWIGAGAFVSCSRLKVFELPDGLEGIDNRTFSSCRSLKKIRIPPSVTRIVGMAFSDCSNLKSIEISEGLLTIGDYAFCACPSLGSICFPSTVENVGEGAFHGCNSLDLVELHEDLPMLGQNAFRGCPAVRFRFVRLSERREAIALDRRANDTVDGILNEAAATLLGPSPNAWGECQETLRRAHGVLADALRENTTTFELALWGEKLREEGLVREGIRLRSGTRLGAARGGRGSRGRRKRDRSGRQIGEEGVGRGRDDAGGPNPPLTPRQECRVQCGAGAVIRSVLDFIPPPWP